MLRLFWAIPLAALASCNETDGLLEPQPAGGASGDAGAPQSTQGGSLAAGSPGSGGADAGPRCHELEPEPNDTQGDALERETLEDCDDAGGTMTGTLAGAGDVDVWAWSGQDTAGCLVNPSASSFDPVRLCLFAECLSGGSVGCASGFPSSSEGVPGCCVLAPGALELELDCDGAADDAAMWVTVAPDPGVPGVGDCFDYQASLHF